MAVSESGNRLTICPVCGSRELFKDPECEGRIRCMNPHNAHHRPGYGETVEVIPLATPQVCRHSNDYKGASLYQDYLSFSNTAADDADAFSVIT